MYQSTPPMSQWPSPATRVRGTGLTAERDGDCVLKIADHQPIVGQGIAVGHDVEGERFGFRVFRISENGPSWCAAVKKAAGMPVARQHDNRHS